MVQIWKEAFIQSSFLLWFSFFSPFLFWNVKSFKLNFKNPRVIKISEKEARISKCLREYLYCYRKFFNYKSWSYPLGTMAFLRTIYGQILSNSFNKVPKRYFLTKFCSSLNFEKRILYYSHPNCHPVQRSIKKYYHLCEERIPNKKDKTTKAERLLARIKETVYNFLIRFDNKQ